MENEASHASMKRHMLPHDSYGESPYRMLITQSSSHAAHSKCNCQPVDQYQSAVRQCTFIMRTSHALSICAQSGTILFCAPVYSQLLGSRVLCTRH